MRYIDHIADVFGPNPGQKRGYCGHQEIELALVKLFHVTGIRKYLDLATYFIDERGALPHYFDLEREARGVIPPALVHAAKTFSHSVSSGELQIPSPSENVARWPVIGERLHEAWSLAHSNLQEAVAQAAPRLKTLAATIAGTLGAAFGAVISEV